MQTMVETTVKTDVAERIAQALEAMVEKLSNIEVKIEELTYEVQSHGNILTEILAGEDMEMGCGDPDCDSEECSAELVEIDK